MENAKSTSWLAVIGVVVTVLTFYYNRRDKAQEEREKAATERPILSVQEGQLISRRIGSDISLSKWGSNYATGALTVVSHGNRIASNATIVVGPDNALSRLFPIPLGDIAPNQSVEAQVVSQYALPKYPFLRGVFEGVLRYSDKIEASRQFEERFCFEAPFIMGVDENLQPTNRLPLVNYSPPEKVTPCGPFAHVPHGPPFWGQRKSAK
jgi:hypothetical protein